MLKFVVFMSVMVSLLNVFFVKFMFLFFLKISGCFMFFFKSLWFIYVFWIVFVFV